MFWLVPSSSPRFPPRKDGSPVRTYYYGCGSYIRKGRAACRFGSVNQEKLELLMAVRIRGILAFVTRPGFGSLSN